MSERKFCGAEKRPELCKVNINLCCLLCKFQKECLEEHKKQGKKILPCSLEKENEGKEELDCPFLI